MFYLTNISMVMWIILMMKKPLELPIKIEKIKYISIMLEEYMKYAWKNIGKYRIEVDIFEKV